MARSTRSSKKNLPGGDVDDTSSEGSATRNLAASNKFKWTLKREEELCEEWESTKFLYDGEHRSHRRPEKREKAIKRIALKLGIDLPVVKLHMRTLRTAYSKIPADVDTDELSSRQREVNRLCAFLRPHIVPKLPKEENPPKPSGKKKTPEVSPTDMTAIKSSSKKKAVDDPPLEPAVDVDIESVEKKDEDKEKEEHATTAGPSMEGEDKERPTSSAEDDGDGDDGREKSSSSESPAAPVLRKKKIKRRKKAKKASKKGKGVTTTTGFIAPKSTSRATGLGKGKDGIKLARQRSESNTPPLTEQQEKIPEATTQEVESASVVEANCPKDSKVCDDNDGASTSTHRSYQGCCIYYDDYEQWATLLPGKLRRMKPGVAERFKIRVDSLALDAMEGNWSN